MLGKLIKYEYRFNKSWMLVCYLGVIVLSGLAWLTEFAKKTWKDNAIFPAADFMTTMMAIIAIVALVISTFLLCVLRYRKTLFKDEGYLMQTVPVTAHQLVQSKVIVSTLWTFQSLLIAIVGIGLVFHGFDFLKPIIQELQGQDLGRKIVIFVGLNLLVSIPASYLQFFAAISVGHSSTSTNKDIMSVIVFAATYAAQQALGLVTIVIASIVGLGGVKFVMKLGEESVINDKIQSYVTSVIVGSSIDVIIMLIAFYFISVKMIDKHLNIE